MLHSRCILKSSFPPVVLVKQDATDRRLLLLRLLQQQIILSHICLWPANVIAHLIRVEKVSHHVIWAVATFDAP